MSICHDALSTRTTLSRSIRGGLAFVVMFVTAGLWKSGQTTTTSWSTGISVQVKVKRVNNVPSPVMVQIDREGADAEDGADLPYRFCSVPDEVRPHQTEGFPIRYHCEGPVYDEFADKLHEFVKEQAKVCKN